MPRKNCKGLPSSLALAALFFAASGAAQATTINARSLSLTDLRAAIASAADGDTVIVPAGTAVWRSGLTITKGITLQGQTICDSDTGVCQDNTVILDSDQRRQPGGYPFIIFGATLGKSYRVTGITFANGSATITNNNGAVWLSGLSHSVRLDHCHFNDLSHESDWIDICGAIEGVIDHNVCTNTNGNTFHVFGDAWPNPDGSRGVNGDGAWSAPLDAGTEKAIFIEDNYCTAATGGATVIDDLAGARWVYRHNHLHGDAYVQSHGTENGRTRGGRFRDVYANDFHNTTTHGVGGNRSGVTLFHDNTFDGAAVGTLAYGPQAFRAMFQWPNNPTFHGATGDNPWDANATEPDGTHVDGHPPYLFESGTATGGGQQQIIDTTKNWVPNQWAGFTAKYIGDNQVAHIVSNTSNTLNVVFYTDSGGGHVWRAGDGYQIHKLLIALDQPGRGQGDLLVGDSPINSRTGTAAWPNQRLEPMYGWNNIYTPTNTPVNILPGVAGFMLVEGRDYFNNTVMPGYTPYVYPHPLTRGLRPAEQMTRNATGDSQDNPHKKRQPWGGKKLEGKKAKKAKESPTNETADGQKNLGE
jgi:hypothetical protein